ncbi:MAG: DUF1016 domain-containing protein [Erysipelotrichaceae bacterium]|nr:DUF1016 domain-containing protein [Erysipelotrichaceae bacterium]
MNNLLDLRIDAYETSDIMNDVKQIIDDSRNIVYKTIDIVLLQRNWLIGKRIYEEELKETRKENYGREIIVTLSKELTKIYGKGFDRNNLYNYLKFYKIYQNIFYTVCKQSFLSWSHYRLLISINDKNARIWYEKEAYKNAWSVRTLQRNISTQYYYRMLSSQIKENIKNDDEEAIVEEKIKHLEHIKNPLILDFLGIPENAKLRESVLEQAILSNLQVILMELGKGYAFVGRQYHIRTDNGDYYVDLVFYNYILKCFILVDLKVGEITHQDIGQMDMYVRMFDELIKDKSDNPTLGIVLCSETNADIAKYSILKGNEHLFATKYKLYLPNELDLKAEIEHQKEIFYSQQNEEK